MSKGKELLAYLSIKNNGNWDAIYQDIKLKEYPESDEKISEAISKIKCNYVTLIDEEYPKCIKRVFKPPFVIFYYGDLSLAGDENKNITIVGSRKPEKVIIEPARHIIREISKKLNVVSGLAYGIDALAHRTCLEVGGKTIAVLGNGIEFTYLKENIDLYNEIKEKGLILSEYPGYSEPSKETFPFRNRILACLSKNVFIPDIHIASGTYSTFSNAMSMGKDVFVFPHPPMTKSLNNTLIKEGAKLVDCSEDILDEYT